MSRHSTIPTLFDSCMIITTSDLKRYGYLVPNQIKSGILTWKCNGHETGNISIYINMDSSSPYMELDYKYNGNPVKYQVSLVSIPSNLGIGKVWFFVCPRTYKRCRKLHCISGHFLHRSAFRGCYYEKQVQSSKNRDLIRQYEKFYNGEKAQDQTYKKYFKKQYKGLLTRRYVKVLRQIGEGNSVQLLEKLLIK